MYTFGPELHRYSALYELLIYDEMKAVLAEMRRRQPDNLDVEARDEDEVAKAGQFKRGFYFCQIATKPLSRRTASRRCPVGYLATPRFQE